MFGTFKAINDNIGKVATFSGLLLLPFFGAAATAYAATHGAAATAGGTLGSFWSTLVTDHATGQISLAGGVKDIFSGWGSLAKNFTAVAAAPFKGGSVMEALAAPAV